MRKMATILAMVLMSSTVFAGKAPKMESYACGLAVGKQIGVLEGTSVEGEINSLAKDIENNRIQSKLAQLAKKKGSQQQMEVAARNSWQSILNSMNQLDQVAPISAAAVRRACGL